MSVVPEPDQAFLDACASLGDDLGWALGALFRSYRETAKRAFGELAGGQRGYQVLRFAVEEAAPTQLALAQQLGIDRTVMTYLLDDLEKAGLVERRPDPADRRARRIVATPEGRARLGEIDTCLREAERELLTPLSAEESAAFRGMLQKLTTADDRRHTEAACSGVEQDDALAAAAPARRARRAR